MKRVIYLTALIALSFFGCEKRRDAATELTSPEFSGNAVEEVSTADVAERRRTSHIDFQKAVQLYNQKKYEEAGEFMRQGNASLKGELHTADGDLKREAVDLVREITFLVGKVKDGDVKSSDALLKPLMQSQRIVARNYFQQVEKNMDEQPDEITHKINLGLEAMENSFLYGNSRPEGDLQAVIAETREMVNTGTSLDRKQIAAQMQKLSETVRGQ